MYSWKLIPYKSRNLLLISTVIFHDQIPLLTGYLTCCHCIGLPPGVSIMWGFIRADLRGLDFECIQFYHYIKEKKDILKAAGSSEKYYWKRTHKEQKYPTLSWDIKKCQFLLIISNVCLLSPIVFTFSFLKVLYLCILKRHNMAYKM